MPCLQSTVGALRAAGQLERTGLHRRRTHFQPATPTAGRTRRGRQRRTCRAQSCSNGGGGGGALLFIPSNHRHPLPLESLPPKFVGPLQPPPYSQRSFTSQKLNHSPACSQQSTPPLSKEFERSPHRSERGVKKGWVNGKVKIQEPLSDTGMMTRQFKHC